MDAPVDFILPKIRRMQSYVPGFQPADPEVIKLNTNENPFPPTEKVIQAIVREAQSQNLHKYPDPYSRLLREGLSKRYSKSMDHFLIGNGSDEILSIVFRSVLEDDETCVCARPTYSLYPVLAQMVGAAISEIDVRSEWKMDFSGMLAAGRKKLAKLTIITNPNAPTGIGESAKDILEFAQANNGLTLVDEAYVDFGAESVSTYAGTDVYPRLMVTGTFSKAYSLAGQRIGWLIAHPSLCVEFEKVKDSYNVSRIAQAAALAAITDSAELIRRNAVIQENRAYLTEQLRSLEFFCLDSSANFIFVSPPGSERPSTSAGSRLSKDSCPPAEKYFKYLSDHKILIRYFSADRCRDYVRITVGSREQIEKLLTATKSFLAG